MVIHETYSLSFFGSRRYAATKQVVIFRHYFLKFSQSNLSPLDAESERLAKWRRTCTDMCLRLNRCDIGCDLTFAALGQDALAAFRYSITFLGEVSSEWRDAGPRLEFQGQT